jgi:hypothetical protein
MAKLTPTENHRPPTPPKKQVLLTEPARDLLRELAQRERVELGDLAEAALYVWVRTCRPNAYQLQLDEQDMRRLGHLLDKPAATAPRQAEMWGELPEQFVEEPLAHTVDDDGVHFTAQRLTIPWDDLTPDGYSHPSGFRLSPDEATAILAERPRRKTERRAPQKKAPRRTTTRKTKTK